MTALRNKSGDFKVTHQVSICFLNGQTDTTCKK